MPQAGRTAWGYFLEGETVFIKIYNELFDYGLKPKELMVYLFLLYCQNCLGTATVRNCTIQQRCGLSENTIRSAITGLVEKRLLTVTSRKNQEGRRISNQYQLHQLSGAWAKLPAEAFDLSARDFMVYAYLCRCSNRQHKAFPSFARMATVLHMAKSTVQAAIKSLVAAGRLLKAFFWAGKHNLYILVETALQVVNAVSAPSLKKENRRAGTRRLKRDFAGKHIANLKYKLNILQFMGSCQEILRNFAKRVCRNLRSSNKTNLIYSTERKNNSIHKVSTKGKVYPAATAPIFSLYCNCSVHRLRL